MAGACAGQYIGTSIAGVCGSYLFMSMLNEYIRKRTDISGLCERVVPITTPAEEYDFVVVGGGSGGATAAGRLARLGRWTVLLVEAGSDEPAGSQVPSMYPVFTQIPALSWNYTAEPQDSACLNMPEHRCDVYRAKVLGGCSAVNGMMYMRGIPQDFQRWVDAGNVRWSYKEVLPFFKSVEGNKQVGTVADPFFHGTGGPLTVQRFPYCPSFAKDLLRGARELGLGVSKDLNGRRITGFSIAQATNRNGTRLSASKAFLWPQRNNPYLKIMLNSTVTRLVFEDQVGKRAKLKRVKGIELVYNSKKIFVGARKEVILSAGAINSPQLLLLSGVGPKQHLKSLNIPLQIDLPGVGRNLQNHVSFTLTYALTKMNDTNDLTPEALDQYFANHTGPMSSTGMAQVTARLNSKYAQPDHLWPDLQFFFSGFNASCATNESLLDGAHKTIDVMPVVLHTKSRGQIRLWSSDPLRAPKIIVNDLTHPDDLATLIDGVRIAQRISTSDTLQNKYGISLIRANYSYCDRDHEYDSDEFWACAIRYTTSPENHQVGTCKMGVDRASVVDQRLLVRGTANLRIMDASVMPFVTSGNTAATVMMIAERGVSFVVQAHAP